MIVVIVGHQDGPAHELGPEEQWTLPRLAGAQLRRQRIAAGLTQAALAEQAQISARTLRNVESGVLTPYRATLVRIAEALCVTDPEGFVAAWHSTDNVGRSDDDLLRRPVGFERFLTAQARRARLLEQTVATSSHAYVGADRNIDRTVISLGVRAMANGLDRSTVVTHSPQPIDWDRLQVVDLINCRLGASRAFPDAPAKTFELLYDVSLTAGEAHQVGYTVDYAGSRTDAAATVPCVEAGVGVRNPGTVVNLQVHFAAGCLPTEVRYEFTERSYSSEQKIERLRLSPFGRAQIVIPQAAVGMHSILWAWA
jgi:transcriptional regulator with XRE-family HTH domain